MTTTPAGPGPFKWIGGALCLDFNNTVDWDQMQPTENERLTDVPRIVAWGVEAGLLSPGERRHWLREAVAPARAERAVRAAHDARRIVHGLFYQLASGGRPETTALSDLNRYLAGLPPQVTGTAGSRGFGWRWPAKTNWMAPVLWPVLWSAGQLLTSPELARVKTCANQNCGWLFVDRSRKHNRRWCEMGICGNRAKVQRFYARQKARRGE
jgi:predicted RNA-binding Zn ribbon-like protein